jgi:hypothetical protein
VKKFLKGWGFNLVGSMKKRKREIQEELLDLETFEENGIMDEEWAKKKVAMKVELFHILEDDELYWYMRSHETWLLNRDNNTEFFYRVANGIKRKQTISSLKDGHRTVIGNENLLELATSYYKTLFGPGIGKNLFEINPNLWQEEGNVSCQENDDLTQPFLEEEIRTALFPNEKNKATGPDGIPIEFFQV